MERIRCSRCGKPVSTEVPDGTVIRAWIECPECIEANPDAMKIWQVYLASPIMHFVNVKAPNRDAALEYGKYAILPGFRDLGNDPMNIWVAVEGPVEGSG